MNDLLDVPGDQTPDEVFAAVPTFAMWSGDIEGDTDNSAPIQHTNRTCTGPSNE